jgi:hypothetical protein
MLNQKAVYMKNKEEYLDITLKASELLDGIRDNLIEYLTDPGSTNMYYSKDLLNKVYKQLVANLYTSNEIKVNEVGDKQIVKTKVLQFLRRNHLSIVTTYTEAILNQANQFLENGKKEFSLIFYAMYFEHTINGIIKRLCKLNRLPDKTSNEIIRSTNVATKFSWLLQLLGLGKFSERHFKVIQQVMEKRNSIIHYK